MGPTLRVIDQRATQMIGLADYVWHDLEGSVCFKTRVIPVVVDEHGERTPIIERWAARVHDLQLVLHPAHYLPDPLRPEPSYIVLCEVRDTQGYPVESNIRAKLRKDLDREGHRLGLWWGFRQDYTIEPHNKARDIQIHERHLRSCVDAGLMIHSARINSTCRQFQIGPRGLPKEIDDEPTALVVADHAWIARYLLLRLAQEDGRRINHPIGTECSVFFSTADMREHPAGVEIATKALDQNDRFYTTRLSAANQRDTHIEMVEVANSDPYQIIHCILTILCGGGNGQESGDSRRVDFGRKDNPDPRAG